MEKYYRFAGIDLAVSIPDDWMYRDDQALALFRVDSLSDPHWFRFSVAEELPLPESVPVVSDGAFLLYREGGWEIRYVGADGGDPAYAHMRVREFGKEHEVLIKRSAYGGEISAKAVLRALRAEHLAAQSQGFLFHCACIACRGKAILFTAPSGTGKTTQAELWKKHRNAVIINGDRAAIRLIDGIPMAQGVPYLGSSDYCENQTLPIAAIVYLSQAPKTTVRRLRGYEAFSRIWEGISAEYWDRADMERISHVAEQTAAHIPVFHMPCTPDEDAVTVLEEALRKQGCI